MMQADATHSTTVCVGTVSIGTATLVTILSMPALSGTPLRRCSCRAQSHGCTSITHHGRFTALLLCYELHVVQRGPSG